MKEVKLLRIVEENIPCVGDHLVRRYMDNSWSILPDTDQVINAKVDYKENIIPISHYCERSIYPLEGFELEERSDTPEKIYSKDTYIAVDYENSQYLKDWINNQNSQLKNNIECLETLVKESMRLKDQYYSDLQNVCNQRDKIYLAGFFTRLKWLFTGVKVERI